MYRISSKKHFPWKKQHPGDDGYFIRLSDRSEEVRWSHVDDSCLWSCVVANTFYQLAESWVSGTNAWKQYKYYCIQICVCLHVNTFPYIHQFGIDCILHTSIYHSIIQRWLSSNGLKVLKYLKHMVKNILQQQESATKSQNHFKNQLQNPSLVASCPWRQITTWQRSSCLRWFQRFWGDSLPVSSQWSGQISNFCHL